MSTFIKAKLKKSDDPTNYRVIPNIKLTKRAKYSLFKILRFFENIKCYFRFVKVEEIMRESWLTA